MTIEQIHESCLQMAIAFDEICKRYEIPYYMLGGTMLGAIRHKGFIPWDDDMDFGVPRNYYEELFDKLSKDLPSSYRCSSCYNNKNVIFPYFKIEDINTRLDTAQLKGDVINKIGINIDIFPLDECNYDDKWTRLIILVNTLYGRIFTYSDNRFKNIIKTLIRICIPISQKRWLMLIDFMTNRLKGNECLGNLFGHWKNKEIIPNEWYGEGVYYFFEGICLRGIKEYDKYLRRLYGDYTQLPPVEFRQTHGSSAYLLS